MKTENRSIELYGTAVICKSPVPLDAGDVLGDPLEADCVKYNEQ